MISPGHYVYLQGTGGRLSLFDAWVLHYIGVGDSEAVKALAALREASDRG